MEVYVAGQIIKLRGDCVTGQILSLIGGLCYRSGPVTDRGL